MAPLRFISRRRRDRDSRTDEATAKALPAKNSNAAETSTSGVAAESPAQAAFSADGEQPTPDEASGEREPRTPGEAVATDDSADREKTPEEDQRPGNVDVAAEGADAGTGSSGADLIERALASWRNHLREHSGVSPLFDVGELGAALLDLSKAHPSGIARLYAGRDTRLTSLVREKGALADARKGARAVLQYAEELAQRYSTAPIYLVVGLARWADVESESAGLPGEVNLAHAPVLMRPLHLSSAGGEDDDYVLLLEPGIEINPVFARALRRAGAGEDLDALAALSLTEHGFSPHATVDRLSELAETHLTDFEVADRLYAGPFVHPGQLLLDDLDAVESLVGGNKIVRALAGDIEAKLELSRPLPPPNRFDREPDAERGVGDLDPIEQSAIDQVASGRSLILDARPGSDSPAVVAAVLADAAASGRRVVHVPGTRRAGRAVVKALGEHGLGDLILDLQESAWRSTAPARLRGGLEPWEDRLDDDAVRRRRATLHEARGRLETYMKALHRERDPWRISAHDSLQHLAELTTSASGPSTSVRLSRETIGGLDDTTRADAAEKLRRFAILGGFSNRRTDTPWFGARVRNHREASDALERSQILAEVVLPKVIADAERVSDETGLRQPGSLNELHEQLEMMEGIRESLDVFQPMIFERSAADMVIATATAKWRTKHQVEMPAAARRRLTKQAKDMQRPGVVVENLHEALSRVQRQREVWRRHNPSGGWPKLPQGLGEARRSVRDAVARLDGLSEVFPDRELFDIPLEELREFLLGLGADPSALRYLPELNTLDIQLNHLGLNELVVDLRERQVEPDCVAAELELSWWASVLESILESDPALARHDGASLNALADSFRELDRAQVASLPGPVRRAVDRRRARVISADKEKARELWIALSSPHGTNLRMLRSDFGELLVAARPIWVIPPLAVGQALPPEEEIDLLVIDGAHHLPTAHVAAAIARASQVVLVGDTSRPGGGLIDELAGTLPPVLLPTDRSRREEHLASFLAGGGWEGSITTLPAPPSPSRIRLHVVEGYGMPAIGAVAVEGVPAEVEASVALARQHVRKGETVAVVSLSQVTAARIREAMAEDLELGPVLADHDRLIVVDAEGAAGLHRDVVILSVGFGKTPHGRVLHRFGPISAPEGLALMIDILDVVVHDLEIVSCLAPDDIEPDRLHHPGTELLAELLNFASDRPGQPGSTKARSRPDEGEPDRLLVDLSTRLRRHGLEVVPQYGFQGGVRIPLAVGHPDRPGELFVGVLTDDANYVAEPSLRRRDRYWVERLESHGWVPHMAFSQAVFMDPDLEVRAIAAKVRSAIEASSEPGAGAEPELTNAEPEVAHPEPEPEPAELEPRTAGPEPEVTDSEPQPTDIEPDAPRLRVPRPDVPPGLPIREYSERDLDELVAWVASDGVARDTDTMVVELRRELGFSRRGSRIEEALRSAVKRHG